MQKAKTWPIILALLLGYTTTQAQTLPKDRAEKEYFKALQTQRVASTDLIEWHQFGPGTAGYSEKVWQHPTDPKVMIMSPDMHNTYGTWDGGESWQTVKDVDDNRVIFNRVMCLDFAPTAPDFGLAVESHGILMVTKDRGHNWVDSGFTPGLHSAIAVDPTNENVWYMGPGDFWNVKANRRNIHDLEDPGYSVRFKNEGYIYKTTDGGKSWKKMSDGVPKDVEVGRILINPANTNELYFNSNHGIYKSIDGGESWKESYAGIPNRIIRDFDYQYDSQSKKLTLFALDQTVYHPDGKSIKCTGGVYRSDDHGKSWVNITGNLAVDLTQITMFDKKEGNESAMQPLYVKTVANWFDMDIAEFEKQYPESPKEIYSVFNRLRINPMNPDEIYISGNYNHDSGFGPGDVWKSEDGGKTWFVTARSGKYWINNTDAEYWLSRNTPLGANEEFAHMQEHINIQDHIRGNRIMEMCKDGTLYTGFEQHLMRTTDGGKSWHQRDDIETSPGTGYWIGRGGSNLPGRFINLETGIKDRILLCSGEHGLWQTNSREGANGGKVVAVKQIEGQCHEEAAHSIADVAVDPNDPNTIYTIQFRQDFRGFFRRSTDGGDTWENIGEPLPLTEGAPWSHHIFQNSLLVDYKNPKRIYFSVIENYLSDVHGSKLNWDTYPDFGVHRSVDGGYTWEKVNSGLPEGCSVRRLAMDTQNPMVIYAALNYSRKGVKGGLYKTTNGGDSWTKVEIPKPIIAVNNVFVDRNNHDIFISCGRADGTLEEGGVWRSSDNGASWQKIFFLDYIWQCESSPADPNIIMVNVAGKSKGDMNPGAYVTMDGGKTWDKVNQNLGQPNTITDLKPDTYDTTKFWAALKGSGWAIGYLKGTK